MTSGYPTFRRREFIALLRLAIGENSSESPGFPTVSEPGDIAGPRSLLHQKCTAVVEEVRPVVRAHRGAHALSGQHFEQERAGHATVDDVYRPHPLAHGPKCGEQPRLHSALDDMVAQQRLGIARLQDIRQLPV